MGIVFLFLLNFAFFGVLLAFVRRYIRTEIGKAEYARHLERELQGLLLEVNRSGAEIAEVIEQRSNELQKLLSEQDAAQKFWNEQRPVWESRAAKLRQLDEQLELQRQNVRELQSEAELPAIKLRLHALEEKLESCLARLAKIEEGKNILEPFEEAFASKWQSKFAEWERKILFEMDGRYEKLAKAIEELEQLFAAEQEKCRETESDTQNGELQGGALLTQEQRTKIERYIELGVDDRIISQKTGVSLNLIEIMVGVRGN